MHRPQPSPRVPSPPSRSLAPFLLLLLAIAKPSPAASGSQTDYSQVVRAYADAMIEHGRDKYGSQQSGLFLSALNRMTMAPLSVRPSPPAGIRRGDRPGRAWSAMNGANPQLDQNFLRSLYTLSLLTGESRYARAADESLTWFLNNTQSPTTGLLPWGEHMSWDVIHDIPISGGEDPVHEFARPWMLWDRCFELAPLPSRRFALGLWHHQIADHKTGGFDRHAPYFEHGPRDGKDFARHAGFYIHTWAHAYKHTGDETLLQAIEVLLRRFEVKRVQKDGSMAATIGPLDCHAASTLVPEPLAARLRDFALKEDELILAAEPALDYPKWQSGYSAGTLASAAMFHLARHQQTGQPAHRDAIVRIATSYFDNHPEEDLDVWPMTFAHIISTQTAAYRLTKEDRFLEQSGRFADMAVKLFWQDKPIPRASLKTDHYETITGADSLAIALLDLHATREKLTLAVPLNTIDR